MARSMSPKIGLPPGHRAGSVSNRMAKGIMPAYYYSRKAMTTKRTMTEFSVESYVDEPKKPSFRLDDKEEREFDNLRRITMETLSDLNEMQAEIEGRDISGYSTETFSLLDMSLESHKFHRGLLVFAALAAIATIILKLVEVFNSGKKSNDKIFKEVNETFAKFEKLTKEKLSDESVKKHLEKLADRVVEAKNKPGEDTNMDGLVNKIKALGKFDYHIANETPEEKKIIGAMGKLDEFVKLLSSFIGDYVTTLSEAVSTFEKTKNHLTAESAKSSAEDAVAQINGRFYGSLMLAGKELREKFLNSKPESGFGEYNEDDIHGGVESVISEVVSEIKDEYFEESIPMNDKELRDMVINSKTDVKEFEHYYNKFRERYWLTNEKTRDELLANATDLVNSVDKYKKDDNEVVKAYFDVLKPHVLNVKRSLNGLTRLTALYVKINGALGRSVKVRGEFAKMALDSAMTELEDSIG